MMTQITIEDLRVILLLVQLELKRANQQLPTNSIPKNKLEDLEEVVYSTILDSNVEIKVVK